MKQFLIILNNKLTLGFILGILASFIAAIFLKFSFEHLFYIYPIKGGLNIWHIGYFFSIAFRRLLFYSLLQLILGEYFYITVNVIITKPNSITLFTNRSDSTSNTENLSPDKVEKIEVSDIEKSITLQENIFSNIKLQNKMVQKLFELKRSHDINYFDVNGALQIDAPANLSESELNKLSMEVGVIDRIINTKISEFNSLEKELKNNSLFDSKYKKSISECKDLNLKRYKSLFEK